MEDIKIVATHDGKFHPDEIFSIAILRKTYPDLTVIRTRDPEKLSSADMRVDVGGFIIQIQWTLTITKMNLQKNMKVEFPFLHQDLFGDILDVS